jgi:hypothetical protein
LDSPSNLHIDLNHQNRLGTKTRLFDTNSGKHFYNLAQMSYAKYLPHLLINLLIDLNQDSGIENNFSAEVLNSFKLIISNNYSFIKIHALFCYNSNTKFRYYFSLALNQIFAAKLHFQYQFILVA